MGKKYQQMTGEKLPEFRARCAAAEAAEKAEKKRQAKNARQRERRAAAKQANGEAEQIGRPIRYPHETNAEYKKRITTGVKSW